NDALGRHDARGGIGPLHLGRACPARLLRLIEPSIQGGFHRRLILVPGERLHKLSQGSPGNDPHTSNLLCAHFGRNDSSSNATRSIKAAVCGSTLIFKVPTLRCVSSAVASKF